MPLVSGKEWLIDARKRGYAIPQFNVLNLEMIDAVITIAEETSSPVIIGIVDRHFPLLNVESLIYAVKLRASKSSAPIILHLDHGRTWERVMEALRLGFTSVMYDGSVLPIQENIQITKDIKRCADPMGVSVEAEIGHVGSKNAGDGNEVTSISEAIDFVNETNVDYLAISIGNTHGHVNATNFDFEVLESIYNAVNVPLVLHGGSDISKEHMRLLISKGISKVNIFSEFAKAYVDGIKGWYENEKIDYLDLNHYGKENGKKLVYSKFDMLNTFGKVDSREEVTIK